MSQTSGKPNKDQVAKYVNENFGIEDELSNWTISDWQENPPLFKEIEDPYFREWARDLNALWKFLAKKIGPDTLANPERHSLIPVDNGFIVPGGRFQGVWNLSTYCIKNDTYGPKSCALKIFEDWNDPLKIHNESFRLLQIFLHLFQICCYRILLLGQLLGNRGSPNLRNEEHAQRNDRKLLVDGQPFWFYS